MSCYLDGEIVPGKGIGKFKIGCDLDTLKSNIDFECNIRDTEYGIMIDDIGPNIRFIVNGNNCLQRIVVFNNFIGKFLGKIGIGSVLSDFNSLIEYKLDEYDSDDRFALKKYDGISFYLRNWSSDDSEPIK